MDYRIEIIDTTNALEPLVLQYAERDSISLEWLGGDEKTQAIVGSQLSFTLEVNDARDAAYEQYFTSNEKRFQVQLLRDDNDVVIWNGFLLPESYSEPWRGGIFYVQFDATDGLGLLKGKRLSEDYYRDEKNVIEILCAILSITAIDVDLYFSPAIVNFHEARWDNIFFDTWNWYDEDKNPDAYELLEELLESMRCQVYQADNRWYIEGFNKKQLLSATYDIYNLSAVYQSSVSVTKNVKELTYLPTPTISMIPALGSVTVKQELGDFKIDSELYKEVDDLWNVNPNSVEPYWYHDWWEINDDVQNFVFAGLKQLTIRAIGLSAFDSTKFMQLKRPIYVKKDWTVNFALKVKNTNVETVVDPDDITSAIAANWSANFIYEILLNGNIIHTNLNASNTAVEKLTYGTDGFAEVDFAIRPEEDGIISIKLFSPVSIPTTLYFSNVRIENLNFSREDNIANDVVTIINDADASREDEIDLEISDENSLVNKSFYLDKQLEILSDITANQNRLWFPIIEYITFEGQIYASVSARAAILAYRYRTYTNTIRHTENVDIITGNILNDAEIIFNFNGGEAFVIAVAEEFASGHIMVDARNFQPFTVDRSTWQQWSDAVISVQQRRYTQVVAEIEQNIYKTSHYAIEATVDKPVKFNDTIQFIFKNTVRYFRPTNCSWFPDSGTSQVMLNEMLYEGDNVTFLPPYVDAGPDIQIEAGDTSVTVTAIASSASSVINTIVWTVTSSDGAITIVSPNDLETVVNGLDGDNYTLTITVTDGNGFSASDSMEINRVSASTLVLTQTVDDVDTDIDGEFENVTGKWTITVNPALAGSNLLNLTFKVLIDGSSNTDQFTNDNFMQVTVIKNSIDVFEWTFDTNDFNNGVLSFTAENNVVQINASDTLEVELRANADTSVAVTNHSVDSQSELIFTAATVLNGDFIITNLPQSMLVSATAAN